MSPISPGSVIAEGIVRVACTIIVAFALATANCAEAGPGGAFPAAATGVDQLERARVRAQRAPRAPPRQASALWLDCARVAFAALQADQNAARALSMANACTDAWLTGALEDRRDWRPGRVRVRGNSVQIEFRGMSQYLGESVRVIRASDVSMRIYGGTRFVRPGLGVPVAVVSPRCRDRPLCNLLPFSGVFRAATVWIESDPDADARLVFADPLDETPKVIGSIQVPLAEDTSAAYAHVMGSSPIGRMGLFGLVGGNGVARRAGVYLMEDYDPSKRPLIMVHGLGSSPLTWSAMTNAVWGDQELRRHFQIWYVVYSTDDPLFVTRRRIAGYLDAAWAVLDPDGDDAARRDAVLIGHSLGGVVSRLLCAETSDTLWSAAFSVVPEALRADVADVAAAESLLVFSPYPGVSRAIFLAAPHRGSPLADRWYARLVKGLAGQPPPEIQALRRIAREHPEVVKIELRSSYQQGRITSISTLQAAQPVRRASEGLLPVVGIPYHTIAGRLPSRAPEGDGVVPLASAIIPGAASTLVIESGHDVYSHPDAIAEVVRILHDDLTETAEAVGQYP
ncbi:alpha/beta hydrolase [Lysobacter sp. S4-A87]|uniref:esterase/lipase family protein n=1 Tax=Lysobacter sp. S4-A87 TaxID=2925843 RepID=UPI001F53B6A8|nr:alpha/beta hydrolase [Lysobacter sp. S4-A87]UNK49846.1 alpha/beta hydrolase [Lysobacter sp. S4-A87]